MDLEKLLEAAVERCDARSDILFHNGPKDVRVDPVFNSKLDRLAKAEAGMFRTTIDCKRSQNESHKD